MSSEAPAAGSGGAAGSRNEAAVLKCKGEMEVQEWEMPSPAPDQVLIAIRKVGICGSDVH